MRHSPCLCLARNIPPGWRGPRCGPLSIFCTQISTSDAGRIVVKQSSAATIVFLVFGDDQVICFPMIKIEVQSSYDRYENTIDWEGKVPTLPNVSLLRNSTRFISLICTLSFCKYVVEGKALHIGFPHMIKSNPNQHNHTMSPGQVRPVASAVLPSSGRSPVHVLEIAVNRRPTHQFEAASYPTIDP